jgi:hypothetical protein
MMNISDDLMMMKTRTLNMGVYYQRFFLVILLLLWESTNYCQGIVEFRFLSFRRVEVRIIKIISVNYI